MDLVVLRIDPGDVALLEVGGRADGLGFVERGEVVRLDLAVENLDDCMRVAVVVDGGAVQSPQPKSSAIAHKKKREPRTHACMAGQISRTYGGPGELPKSAPSVMRRYVLM